MFNMKETKIKITFTEEVLGTNPSNQEIYSTYIASKNPDAAGAEEEAASFVAPDDKGVTVFRRNEAGNPCVLDYQWRGLFKDSIGMLRKITGTKSSKVKAYKKMVDGQLFVFPRQIELHLPEGGEMGRCQRPLRAQTMQGERVALADSEAMPAGSWCEITLGTFEPETLEVALECLEYGQIRGFGQWRNSGKGTFTYEIIK